MKKLILMLAALSLTSLAQADILPRAGSLKLVVNTSSDGKSVNFQEVNEATGVKRDLGAKKFYSLEELRQQRHEEGWDVTETFAEDIGLVVATAATDGAICYLFYPVGEAGIWILGASAAADVAAFSLLDFFNPHYQYQQWLCLREEVITDQNITLATDGDVVDFIEALEDVLNGMDGISKNGASKAGKRAPKK